jgi:tRNA(Phe) wybutosine-synthesizing methylase Tyw3
MMEVPTAVYVIWIIVLVVAYAAVPVLLHVLTRILNAAKKIDRYAAETRVSSAGIKSHVSHAPALIETNKLLGAAHGVADEIGGEATTIVTALLQRAGAK